jgi:SAM-dependent methyltransferase
MSFLKVLPLATPAERFLIDRVGEALRRMPGVPHVMNFGAGDSVVIEEALLKKRCRFKEDRVDVEPCDVDRPFVGKAFQCSLERMPRVSSDAYDLGFANYVLEHIEHLPRALKEIHRVLKPGALLVLSSPNPRAPEFLLAHLTPTRFHQLMRGKGEGTHAFETAYAYRSINELIRLCEAQGFKLHEIKYYAETFYYLRRFPVIRLFARTYDATVQALGIRALLGNVGLVFERK